MTQTVLVFLVQTLDAAAVGSAAAAETEAGPEADGTTEPDATAAAPDAPIVEAGAAAPVAEATTAVLVAADEATPPVPAAARTEETEVQAGFLERFSSYRQASPWPSNVEGIQEY